MHDPIIGLFLLIQRQRQSNTPLGRQSLVPFAEIKLPQVTREYDTLVYRLLEQKWIAGNAESFVLTDAGMAQAETAAQQHSLQAWFYDEYYQAVLHSRAHSLFCEQVYGQDLHQHGMTDIAQIEMLCDAMQIQPGMQLLDFGCGDGRMAEYLADSTQAQIVGIDIAEQAIALAQARTTDKSERMRFVCINIEKDPRAFPPESFDCIIAIDSIFFVHDLDAAVRLFLAHLKATGRMGLFFHVAPGTSADQTCLAQTLHQLGVAYMAHDLTVQNTFHWQKKKQTLLELEPLFHAEGNDFLFKNRLAECDGMVNVQRYLYIAQP